MKPNANLFDKVLADNGLPLPERELAFAKAVGRKWRFDFAWPKHKLALEVEGGVFTGGRHTRGKGFLGDMAKYNAAVSLGWRVARCVPSTLCDTDTVDMLRELLRSRVTYAVQQAVVGGAWHDVYTNQSLNIVQGAAMDLFRTISGADFRVVEVLLGRVVPTGEDMRACEVAKRAPRGKRVSR